MIKLMRLDGSDTLIDPRTITRVEREGSVTRIRAGMGSDVLVVQSPAEVEELINADTLRTSRPTLPQA